MGLHDYFHRQINLMISKWFLSLRIRKRADKYFHKTLNDFVKKNKRKPTSDEQFLLVVKASHRTLGIKKARGKKGHLERQWIRKYLLLKHKIRNKYKIQKSKIS
ncbi:hypothetical protein COU58_02840 [Candidatus Pacearchaeota archaeon CG10_big_fil_rev_8_21_14_0_10_32_42]|nr:MAG: hypothetical protein COU58_02840 [Candidatus Pacearchaeota archaeon CG10_big_fil_rev_8_21_14_0_10_32_42]